MTRENEEGILLWEGEKQFSVLQKHEGNNECDLTLKILEKYKGKKSEKIKTLSSILISYSYTD